VALALTRGGVAGEVFNVGGPVTRPIIAWVRQILDAAGHEASLVPVPSAAVPEDLSLTVERPQHLLPGSSKITRVSAGAPRRRRSRSPGSVPVPPGERL
jgi:hypothetical protein